MMIVEPYDVRFMELSYFASYLILNEEKNVKKFECGLHYRIKECAFALRIRSFIELVTHATIVKENL